MVVKNLFKFLKQLYKKEFNKNILVINDMKKSFYDGSSKWARTSGIQAYQGGEATPRWFSIEFNKTKN